MSGKGDKRRPSRIAEREMARRWARAFGGASRRSHKKISGECPINTQENNTHRKK